jgi:hypothetical protein
MQAERPILALPFCGWQQEGIEMIDLAESVHLRQFCTSVSKLIRAGLL